MGCERHPSTTKTPISHGEEARRGLQLSCLHPTKWCPFISSGDMETTQLSTWHWGGDPARVLSWGQRQQKLLVMRIHSGMNRAPDSPVYQGLIRDDPTGWLVLNGGNLIKQLSIIFLQNILSYLVIRPGTPGKQDHETLSSICCFLRGSATLPPQGQPGWDKSSIRAIKSSKNAPKRCLYI